jgi:hypothetical protein
MIRELAQRTVATNAHVYREVNLDFRIARAQALEADKVDAKKDRIRCPVLDASRTISAYGMMALPDTDQAGLDQWSEALELPKVDVQAIAIRQVLRTRSSRTKSKNPLIWTMSTRAQLLN